jgi:hypothetical protein
MPHNHTSPTASARRRAAHTLRSRALELRSLALELRTKDRDRGASFADEEAQELDDVAVWLSEPYGKCDECGETLQHFHSENVGGVVCPDCDGEFVDEVVADRAAAGPCGCRETYPQLVPGRVSHGPGCSLREVAPPRERKPCADCGRLMMPDHSVCFSDDCVRQRAESAAAALDVANKLISYRRCDCRSTWPQMARGRRLSHNPECPNHVRNRPSPAARADAAARHARTCPIAASEPATGDELEALRWGAKQVGASFDHGPCQCGHALALHAHERDDDQWCRAVTGTNSICGCRAYRASTLPDVVERLRRTELGAIVADMVEGRPPPPQLAELPAPCMECGEPLNGARGTLCTSCDPTQPRPRTDDRVCGCGHSVADHRNNDWTSCQHKGCDCAGFWYPPGVDWLARRRPEST